MSSNKKEEVVISNPRSSVEDDAIADLRNALNRLCIPEQQQESILKQLFIDPAMVAVDTTIAAAAAAPSAAAAAAAADDAKNKQGGSKVTRVKLGRCGFGKSDQMDKEYQNDKDSQKFKADDDDADAYGDDDDDDDDSGYDGNVQYPYVKSKIHYDSDEESFVDYELSQQVDYY